MTYRSAGAGKDNETSSTGKMIEDMSIPQNQDLQQYTKCIAPSDSKSKEAPSTSVILKESPSPTP